MRTLRAWVLGFVLVMLFAVSGCITTQYAGYTVVRKQTRDTTQDVPVWLHSCVRPDGIVKCQVRSEGSYPNPGVNECTISCNLKRGDRWDKRQVGTVQQNVRKYTLTLRSPTGEMVDQDVTANFFNQMREGQVISK